MSAGAEIKLSALFSDGMVLQRNKPVAIWGQADPNVKIIKLDPSLQFPNSK